MDFDHIRIALYAKGYASRHNGQIANFDNAQLYSRLYRVMHHGVSISELCHIHAVNTPGKG